VATFIFATSRVAQDMVGHIFELLDGIGQRHWASEMALSPLEGAFGLQVLTPSMAYSGLSKIFALVMEAPERTLWTMLVTSNITTLRVTCSDLLCANLLALWQG
jgi:hypothetical protein